MDHVTATSPNWVVEADSPHPENAQAVEKPNSQWEIEDQQPRPEQIILFENISGTQEVDKEDGEGHDVDDGLTTTKQQDGNQVEEKEIGEQNVHSVENVPSPEKQQLQDEKKEEIMQENLVDKHDGDSNDGKIGLPQEVKLEHEEMTQDTHFVEHQPSTGEHLNDPKPEDKVEENLLVTEDDHDGKKSSKRQKEKTVEQEEKPSQNETQSVENPPPTKEQLSDQEAEESINQKLAGLSLEETEQRIEPTFHAEAELMKNKDALVDQETEQKKDSSFHETGPEEEHKTVQPIGLENVDQVTQGNEVVMEEGKVPIAAEEEMIPVAVEQEHCCFSLAAEKENALEAMQQESSPLIVKEENAPVAMEVDLQAEIVEAIPLPEPDTSREIIDMEPKDVIPQPAAVAGVGEHISQPTEIKESFETIVDESQNEKAVSTPAETTEVKEGEETAPVAPEDEEPKEFTLDEWRALRGERKKPEFNIRKPGEGEDNSQWKKTLNESASAAVNSEVQPRSPTPPTVLPISSSSPSTKVENTSPGDMLHHIKNIQFKDKNVGIVTQNENGPCPLVAIINVLLLRRQITLPAHSEIVSAAKLMEYIGDAMLESVPKNLSGEIRLNYEQNMHDAMAVLPKLQTGLDVNVKFTGVRDFEYTPECIIFDLLRIPLFHGWLVDPQTPEVVTAVGQAGYNQLVEKVISQKCSNDENAVLEALVIENFLERSASQLTYHGLSELTTSMEDDEIGVLFRNNHFSTIYKRQKELLQLVTDQGFLGESSVVWETLGSIDGDGQFVDSLFRTVPPKPELAPSGDSASPNTSAQLTAEQQIDHDFLVALSLQEEQQQEQPAAVQEEVAREVGEDVAKTLVEDDKTTQELLDLELARQLQQEEERQAAEAETVERESVAAASSQSPPAAGQRSPPPPSKKKDCTFL